MVLRTAVASARRKGKLPDDLGALTFADIGANVGTTTVPALRAIGFGRGLAVEPAPSNLRLLRANLALNDLHERVTVVESAIGDRAGTMTLFISRETTAIIGFGIKTG